MELHLEGREVGLEPPTTFTRMVTVCFVPWHTSSLDQKISTWMCVVAFSVTCEQSEICLWKWGTDVEILTLAHMLKTQVYTYHEDTKSRNSYRPNAVELSLDGSNISERGMYIRLARSHFDVVSSVRNQ